MKLSEILEEAIEHLAPDWPCGGERKFIYSCNAIKYAINSDAVVPLTQEIKDLLEEMGMDVSAADLFDDCPDPQYARALWLTWVAMVTKEWGL